MTKKKASNIFSGKAKLLPATKCLADCFPKPIGKPATIFYKKLPDDMILITGFENFLTSRGIQEKYGFEVVNLYCTYPDYMSLGPDCVHVCRNSIPDIISIGKMYNKDYFSKLVSHVKKCGGLLHDIIKAVNGGEVKRITI
jgi:hypothetical protein